MLKFEKQQDQAQRVHMEDSELQMRQLDVSKDDLEFNKRQLISKTQRNSPNLLMKMHNKYCKVNSRTPALGGIKSMRPTELPNLVENI